MWIVTLPAASWQWLAELTICSKELQTIVGIKMIDYPWSNITWLEQTVLRFTSRSLTSQP